MSCNKACKIYLSNKDRSDILKLANLQALRSAALRRYERETTTDHALVLFAEELLEDMLRRLNSGCKCSDK
ncbi:MAG: hypothetical protein FMNOHCHN_03783 [Ignavibacteriaceae bacterium]|nr:hypothetical protein [Ignavibacteriaceae bacterium]